jgi:hypothetical protein
VPHQAAFGARAEERSSMVKLFYPFSLFRAVIENGRDGSSVFCHVCRAAVFCLCICAPDTSAAETITFQDQALGPYAGGSVTLVGGGATVMFSGTGLRIRDISGFFPPDASRVLSTAGDTGAITAAFVGGFTTNFVGIQNWISGIYTLVSSVVPLMTITASSLLPSGLPRAVAVHIWPARAPHVASRSDSCHPGDEILNHPDTGSEPFR